MSIGGFKRCAVAAALFVFSEARDMREGFVQAPASGPDAPVMQPPPPKMQLGQTMDPMQPPPPMKPPAGPPGAQAQEILAGDTILNSKNRGIQELKLGRFSKAGADIQAAPHNPLTGMPAGGDYNHMNILTPAGVKNMADLHRLLLKVAEARGKGLKSGADAEEEAEEETEGEAEDADDDGTAELSAAEEKLAAKEAKLAADPDSASLKGEVEKAKTMVAGIKDKAKAANSAEGKGNSSLSL